MYKTIYKDLRHLQHSSLPVASGISGQVPKGSCIVQGKCETTTTTTHSSAMLQHMMRCCASAEDLPRRAGARMGWSHADRDAAHQRMDWGD